MSVAAAQTLGLLVTLAILAIVREPAPPQAALAWGALGGCSGVVGLGAFYAALARGSMSIVAPAAAVIGAALPVLVGVTGGERLDAVQLTGVVAALAAVVLIARSSGSSVRGGAADLVLIVVAGLGFAGFFVAMDRSAAEGGVTWWPIVAARVGGLVTVAALVLATRPSLAVHRRAVPLLALAGVGDLGGNLFFVLANAAGELSLATVVSSLYPVGTVALAFVLLRERLSRPQLVGVGLAFLAIALIAG